MLLGALRRRRSPATPAALVDDVLMRATDFVHGAAGDVRRARAARRCCRSCCRRATVFALLAGIFAVVGAPFIARGVRAIVRSERRLDYASRPQSLGASHARLLLRHLLPAARGFIAVADHAARARRSSSPKRRCRTSASAFPIRSRAGARCCTTRRNVRAFADFPWLLSPAAAMFLVVLGAEPGAAGSRRSRRHVARRSYNDARMNLARRLRADSRPRSTIDDRVDTGAAAGGAAHAGWRRRSTASSCSARTAKRRCWTTPNRDQAIVAARDGCAAGHGRSSSAPAASRRRRRSSATKRAAELGADAVLVRTPGFFKSADDERRVRAPLHGGRRRVAGAGAALQLHRGHRREPAAGGGRARWRRTRTSSA